MISHSKYGDIIRQQRKKVAPSLSKFCQNIGEDKSSWSKMERGTIPPPKAEAILRKYFVALNFPQEDWKDFLYIAAISRGEIPTELLDRRDTIFNLFKTLRYEL